MVGLARLAAVIAARVRPYAAHDFEAVSKLWREVFPDDPPWNRAEVAIPAKLAVQPDLLLVAIAGEQVLGTVMAGYDGHRGWLYSVAVLEAHRRLGIGTMLIREAEMRLQRLGCAKINLQVRAANSDVAEFYKKLGYAIEERVNMGKRV
jgi:ribosomal protein S18 acetylase RimI-like enzyme